MASLLEDQQLELGFELNEIIIEARNADYKTKRVILWVSLCHLSHIQPHLELSRWVVGLDAVWAKHVVEDVWEAAQLFIVGQVSIEDFLHNISKSCLVRDVPPSPHVDTRRPRSPG